MLKTMIFKRGVMLNLFKRGLDAAVNKFTGHIALAAKHVNQCEFQ
jgi:hypothetical protein